MLGFGYNHSREYCEAERSKYHNYQYTQTSTVVEDALKSWLECIRSSRLGITVTPQVYKERAVIDFERTQGTVLGIIRGVDATAGTVCIGQLLNTTGTAQTVTLTPKTSYQLPVAEKFNVICNRAAQNSTVNQGEKIYPRTLITIGTSSGSFSLQMAPNQSEPRGGPQRSRPISRTHAKRSQSSKTATLKLQTDFSNLPKNVEFKDCTLATCDWTNYNNGTDMMCPAGKVLRGAKLGAETFGSNIGYRRMWLACCSVGFAK